MCPLTTDVWNVSEQDFPWTSSIETQLGFLVRYAILAPSTRNSQPWAFSIQGSHIHLLADLRRGQAIADPNRRELYISLGCALENLLVAAEHFGFRHGVSYFPDPGHEELAATVLFAPGGAPAEDFSLPPCSTSGRRLRWLAPASPRVRSAIGSDIGAIPPTPPVLS